MQVRSHLNFLHFRIFIALYLLTSYIDSRPFSQMFDSENFDQFREYDVHQPTTRELDEILNNEFFEGDILGIDPTDSEGPVFFDGLRFNDEGSDDLFARPYYSSLNTNTYPDKLWKDGKIPYVLEGGMTMNQRAAIASAFEEYKKTCVRFVPRTIEESDYIYVKRNIGFGCSSYVGRAGGNQTVSLEVDKCFSKGIIAHELMHAAGFFHEHSVMHYHKLAFSKNGKPTIAPKKRDAEIGQRYRLSTIDAKKLNKLYKCNDPGDYEASTITTIEKVTTATTAKSNTETTEAPTTEASTTESTTTITTTSTAITTSVASTNTTEEVEPITAKTSWITPETTIATEHSTTTRDRWPAPQSARKFITLSILTSFGGNRKSGNLTLPRERTIGLRPVTGHQLRGRVMGGSGRGEENLEICENKNAHCEMWQKLGHCEHSPKYMSHYCRKACDLCDKKGDGEETTTEKVSTNQRRTSTCMDKNIFCGYWAKIGECKTDSRFMRLFCKRSCGKC